REASAGQGHVATCPFDGGRRCDPRPCAHRAPRRAGPEKVRGYRPATAGAADLTLIAPYTRGGEAYGLDSGSRLLRLQGPERPALQRTRVHPVPPRSAVRNRRRAERVQHRASLSPPQPVRGEGLLCHAGLVLERPALFAASLGGVPG